MDPLLLDGHKLAYHPDRVGEWLSGNDIFPLYVEVSPTGYCNHRCTFCGLDFLGYQARRLEPELLARTAEEMARLGVKSVMFAGEGEPLLHPQFAAIVRATQEAGLDVAITTNAVALSKPLAQEILNRVQWIKASVDAGTPETYATLHGCNPRDFERVLDNLGEAVQLRKTLGSNCTLGIQLLLLPENRQEVTQLARLGRELGVDYLVVKPYSQHTQSLTSQYRDIRYCDDGLAQELAELETDQYRIVFRSEAMRTWTEQDKPYPRCLALPFWSYIDAGGNVWGCSIYLQDERFLYGNLRDSSFEQIWKGEKRQASLREIAQHLDTKQCRINCRMDAINRYLWQLRNPPQHVNFI